MKEEFRSDGLPETEGEAFIEAGKTWVTMKDLSGSLRDAVITSTQQPDISLVKTETMHFRRGEPYGSPRRRVIRHLKRCLGCYADTYKQC